MSMRRGHHETRRLTRALAAALVLHVGVFLAVRARPVTPPPPPRLAEIAPSDLEIGLETPPAPSTSGPTETPAPAEARVAAIAPKALRESLPPAPSGIQREESPGIPAEGEVLAVPAEPSVTGPVMLVRPSLAGLGVPGGRNAFLGLNAVDAGAGEAEQPAPRGERTLADAKRAVERALRDPAREREKELGLGPEGPVLRALGEATEASTAAVRGRAVFVARANEKGEVIGVEVAECDGARAGWSEAAELAKRALVGKKLRMPSSAKHAEMRIEVTSAWKLPSGQDPGTDVSLFGVPVAKGEGKDSPKIEILNPLPKLRTVELAPGVKVAVPIVELTIFSTTTDPSNIGAKPRRIVHTRLLDSSLL